MFSKKKDLDTHIQDVFKKTKTEKERNLKCLTFAKHYAQLKEWSTARRYVCAFLSVRPNSSQALLLQGECDENLGQKERALNEYRSSLAIDGTQRELVFKVCKLLCEVPSDSDTCEYWCERAEQLDNSHPVVFKLKEHMLTIAAEKSDENVVRKELEKLILDEQKARPNDPRPKCRLLKLYLEKGQISKAFQLASQTEQHAAFRNSTLWYETLCEVFEAYQKVQKPDWEFHAQKLLAHERMAVLFLSEITSQPASFSSAPSRSVASTSSCVEIIFQLDQALYSAAKTPYPSQSTKRQLAQTLEKHIAAQLVFHMATLLFRKAKKDGIQWHNAVKYAGPLLLLANQTRPPDSDVAWIKDLTEVQRTTVKCWIAEGKERCSQAGNVLLGLNKKKKFLDTVSAFMVTKWQDRLFEVLFPSLHSKKTTSYFAMLYDTNSVVNTLPTVDDLWPFDEATQLRKRQDLNYLVWYGLNLLPYGSPWSPISEANDDPMLTVLNIIPKHPLCPIFTSLKQYLKDVSMMVPANPETLVHLDLDAFIYGTVVCAFGVLEEQQRRWSEERPSILPTIVTETICTPSQMQWWQAVCWLLEPNSGSKSINSDGRRVIKAGLETIRAVESQSGQQDVRLLCALARFFSGQAILAEQQNNSAELIAALHARAYHYWSAAKPALERIKADRGFIPLPSDRMFTLPGKKLDQQAAVSLLYEANFSAACYIVRAGRIEEAIEAFGELSSPYASMKQALLFKQLADQEESDHALKKTLLSRTRDRLYVTLDRLRAPKVDPRHPLNVELRDHVEEVEDQLNTLFPKCNKSADVAGGHRFGILSDSSSDGENEQVSPYPLRMPTYSTPLSANRMRTPRGARPYNGNGTPSNGIRHTSFHSGTRDVLDSARSREEARPSPERLEAQIRHIMLQKEREDQTVLRLLEASRADDRGLKDVLRELQRKVDDTHTEVQEMRKESQELQKNVKDIQNDVQKIVRAIQANNLQNTSPRVSEAQNIPDEDLYLYGEEEMENEYTQADLAAAAAHLGAPYPQQNAAQSLASARAAQPAHAAAAAAAAAATAAFHALPPGFPFRPPGFFPLSRPVDSALMYQSLGCFGQGALPFSEGQRLPDFQIAPPLIAPQAPVLPPTALPPPQPVFSRLGTVMGTGYEQTDLSTAQAQGEDVRGSAASAQRPVQTPVAVVSQITTSATIAAPTISQDTATENVATNIYLQAPHAFQISMPPQAQIPTESPLEKAPSGNNLVISPNSILQSVPPPEFSSVSPDKQRNQSDTARRSQRLSTGSGVGSEDGEELPEHDPCPDFQPLIPLPDEVVPTTGEEGETVMFESRAQLYRYVEGEWKERGVGLLKILESPVTGKARILMRRDQVLKVCCNHFVPADLKLSRIAANDRTWSWAAPDFADGEMKLEKLGVRFKTSEEAEKFKIIMETAASKVSTSQVSASPATPNVVPHIKSPTLPAPSTPSSVSVGGFTFTAPPTIVQKTASDTPVSSKSKEVDVPKPSPFSNFSFGKPITTSPVFGVTTGVSFGAAQGKTPALETTTVFESSPLSQLSFASIAKQSPQTFQPTQSCKGFENAGAKVFSSIPTTPASSKTSAATPISPEDGSVEDFVPTAEFQPVVPLPELVEIKTGEEGEQILFENRAKLLRYSSNTKEWKERGIGKMKITWDPNTGKVRLIMRREQVLKVCCNHFLTSDMNLQTLTASDRSWFWYANDYSDGTLESEFFAIKFKTRDEALVFKDKWTEIQKEMVDNKYRFNKDSKPIEEKKSEAQKPLSELFKPKSGTWECTACYIVNDAHKTTCIACNSTKPMTAATSTSTTAPSTSTTAPSTASIVASGPQDSLMSKFKPAAGSWECSGCCVRNKADDVKCVCCNTVKPGSEFQIPTPTTTSSGPGGPQFSFGMPKDTTTTTTVAFGSAPAPLSTTQSFMFGTAQCQPATASQPPTSFTFGNVQQTTANSTPSTYSFVATGGTTTQETSVTQANFSFPAVQPTTTAPAFSFGSTPVTVLPAVDKQKTVPAQAFQFGSPHKFQFNFRAAQQQQQSSSPPKGSRSPRSPRTSVSSVTSPGSPGQEDSDDEVEHDEGDHIHFTPVIPLPEVVPVVTGEENEEVLYCQRAKLYRFVEGEWKERGIGDFKILRHKTNKTIRFLMRRDQVLKICLNHRLTPDLLIKPKERCDRSFVWSASDFSEEEMRFQQFALRFKTVEIASTFKSAVARAQAELQGKVSSEEPLPPVTPSQNDESVSTSAYDTPSLKSFSFAEAAPASQTSFSLGGLFGSPNTPNDSKRNIFGGQLTPAMTDMSTATTKVEEQGIEGDDEVEIVSVQVATPEEVEKARKLQLPDNFFLYRLRPDCSGCRGCKNLEPVLPTIPSQQQKKETATPAFSGPAQFVKPLNSNNVAHVVNGKPEVSSDAPGVSFLPTDDKISFASLAEKQPTAGFGNIQTSSTPFSWAGAGTPVFERGKVASIFAGTTKVTPSSKAEKEGDSSGDEEGGEDETTHDPHFEPIVALPDKIEVRTGEEDEEKLFGQRAKLYRYSADTKEWKERGVGEIKILHHKINGTYRLLLRREQVHKLVLNQLINPSLQLSRMATNTNAWCWGGMNFAESKEGNLEELAVRVKNEDIAKEFYDKVEECKSLLLQQKEATSANSQPSVALIQGTENPAVETREMTSTAPATEASEEDGEEDYETYDEDEDEEEEEEATVIFEKRMTLMEKNPDDKWQNLGQGTLRIIHDEHMGVIRCYVETDNTGELLCNFIIDCKSHIERQDKDCNFSSVDQITETPTLRHFKATFSSVQAADEFKINFLEGVQLSEQAEMYGEDEDEGVEDE